MKHEIESETNGPVFSPCREGQGEEGARVLAPGAQPKADSMSGKILMMLVEFEAKNKTDVVEKATWSDPKRKGRPRM